VKKSAASKGKATQGMCALEVVSAIRALASKAKVTPLSACIVDMFKADSSPIVVFVNFRDSAQSLKTFLHNKPVELSTRSKLVCDILTGDIVNQAVSILLL
jgi:ERCC4-related helicase